MTKKLRKSLYKIFWAALFFAAALLPLPQIVKLSFFSLSYVIVGLPIVIKALRNVKNGEVFDENFLMTVATLGAVALGEYPEAVAVMLFFQIGEFFQSYAVSRSRKSIAALMDIRLKAAFPAIALGVVIAGLLVTGITFGFTEIFV